MKFGRVCSHQQTGVVVRSSASFLTQNSRFRLSFRFRKLELLLCVQQRSCGGTEENLRTKLLSGHLEHRQGATVCCLPPGLAMDSAESSGSSGGHQASSSTRTRTRRPPMSSRLGSANQQIEGTGEKKVHKMLLLVLNGLTFLSRSSFGWLAPRCCQWFYSTPVASQAQCSSALCPICTP